MLIKTQRITLLQIFCEFMIESKVILKSIFKADDIYHARRSPSMKGLSLLTLSTFTL